MNDSSITIDKLDDVQKSFITAMDRLGLSEYTFEAEGERHPVDVVFHPYVFLGRLAMSAEETSILIFGARIFPESCFLVNKDTPTGIVIENIDTLTDDQLMDRNIQASQQIVSASMENMTLALRELVIDSAIVDVFEIDPEHKVIREKPYAPGLHALYMNSEGYANGAALPLMSPEMIAINELSNLLTQDIPLLAMNKAREKAASLLTDMLRRRELDVERRNALSEAGLDAGN